MAKIPIVIIIGPTAVGKTKVSLNIAKRLSGEIISADSMQIYEHMDIGTAKPNIEERQGIAHHLIDIVKPDEEFNVSLFQQHAENIIEQIHHRSNLPIIVGGTGLYVHSLIYPLVFSEAGEDQGYRTEIESQAKEKGNEWLHYQLSLVDKETANRLHPNDLRRVIRALEIYKVTGQPMSQSYRQTHHQNDKYSISLIGLTMSRKVLYDLINQRVDIMIERGLVEEVRWLVENGYDSRLISMQGLGYKEIVQYLNGKRTLTEAIYILKRNTRRFAKRQYTWFRRLENIQWIHVDEFNHENELLESVYNKVEKIYF